MLVTLKDVQEYWVQYCERHNAGSEVLAAGLREISLNHEYWADHTMPELKEFVVKRLKNN